MRPLALVALWAIASGASASGVWTTQRPIVWAQAQGTTWASAGPSVSTAIVPRTYENTGNGLGVLRQMSQAPGRLGGVVDVQVSRSLTWAMVGRGVARSLPAIGTAIALAELLDSVRCMDGGTSGGLCDWGAPPVMSEERYYRAHVKNGPNSFVWTGYVYPNLHAARDAAFATWQVHGCGSGCSVQSVHLNTSDPFATSAVYYIVYKIGTSTFQSNGNNIDSQVQNVTACPAGQQVAFWDVTKCTQLPSAWTPTTVVDVESRIVTHGSPTRMPQVVPEMVERGIAIDHPEPTTTLPPADAWQRETTTGPGGDVTVRDWRDEPVPVSVPGAGPGWEWRRIEREETFPPGTPIPPPGELVGGTTTNSPLPSVQGEDIECGLPGYPPCRIDETGTPASAVIDQAGVTEARDSVLDRIGELGAIQAPAWSWSFALPSACSVLTVGPFLSQTVEVDLCQYQAMIHDLLSLAWIGAAIWACVGMVGRTFSVG